MTTKLSSDSWTPIDEREGPTLWAKQSGEHVVELAAGTDPEDPYTILHLSVNDIRKLYSKL